MSWVTDEKDALVATLRSADPHADTLCAGWDVRRLLAHLVQREQVPVAAIGDAVARQPAGQEPGLTRLVERTRTPEGYGALVSRFEAGAPRWLPMSWFPEQLNLIEYVIHHEDIRRAGDDPAEPRTLPPFEQEAIWKQLGLFAKLGLRKSPVGVRLATPTDRTRVVTQGEGVTLTGDPVELALYVSGRREQARVAVTGSPEAIEEFTRWVATS